MSGSEKQRLEIDRRILFIALGFTAIVLKSGSVANQVEQVHAMADLMETFCRMHVPEAFEDEGGGDDSVRRDGMVTAIAEILRADGSCSPHELDGKFSKDEIDRFWKMAYALACVSVKVKREVS